MDKDHKETISIRIINVGFVMLTLAVFKPFGLDAWRWEAYAHLLVLWVLGFGVCFLTEVILKYIANMPRAYERGIDYIILRNLWFQFINTPLAALLICLYRHFLLSSQVEGNRLSWSNYVESLIIVAFCAFVIGLFWRFKFRSRFLAMELEETRLLNEQLGSLTSVPSQNDKGSSQSVTLSGTTSENITLNIDDLLFIETTGNYVKVSHVRDGQVRTDMLRATSRQMEDDLQSYPMIVRCHRAFLVNLGQVEQIVAKSGSMQLIIKHSHDSIPVSRSKVPQIKAAVKRE